MIDIVIKTGNFTSCNVRLKQLGLVVRDEMDDEGNKRTIEQRYEIVNTPMLEDTSGDLYFTIRLSEEQADKLPKNDTPNYFIIYDSRELIEDGEGSMIPMDWPIVEINTYDEKGNVNGIRYQLVGKIA